MSFIRFQDGGRPGGKGKPHEVVAIDIDEVAEVIGKDRFACKVVMRSGRSHRIGNMSAADILEALEDLRCADEQRQADLLAGALRAMLPPDGRTESNAERSRGEAGALGSHSDPDGPEPAGRRSGRGVSGARRR